MGRDVSLRAIELCLRAMDLDPQEREALVRAEAADDPELLAEVNALLAAEKRSSGFLEPPVLASLPFPHAAGPSVEPGMELGAYRILKLLSGGGMGSVYLAERADREFDREVAVKVADRVASPGLLRRFRTERSILAALDHPNIAHLYDAGTLGGVPYFVMELVHGATIDRYCKDRGLGVEARIQLFLEVCAAVAYAHERKVVHRDLKPGNILITGEGRPKLIDFGVAKALDAADTTSPGGTVPLSANYASPEQLLGRRVTEASDVYSLGVVLYLLLTGELPRAVAAVTPAALDQIFAAEPVPPSRRRRRSGSSRLARDLDAIVLKALAVDEGDRYPSAAALAEDLERYLHHIPVRARPQLLGYRGTRFVRRHRARLAVVVALVLAAGATLWWSLSGERDAPGATSPSVAVGLPDAADAADEPGVGDRPLVVVGSFENRTGDGRLDEALDLGFRTGVTQSRRVEVVSERTVRAVLERMERPVDSSVDRVTGMEIGLREGARAVILGRADRSGSGYRLTAELIDPAVGETVWSAEEHASGPEGLLGALDALAGRVRTRLGESRAEVAVSAPLEKVTTSDLEALVAYSEGQAHWRRGDSKAARPLFVRALEIDPDFVLARVSLAVADRYEGRDLGVSIAGLRRALQQRDRLSEFEALYAEGWLATLESRRDEMVRAWSLMAELFPGNPVGHHNLALVYWSLDHDADNALRALRRVPSACRDCGAPSRTVRVRLGIFELLAGNEERARELLTEGLAAEGPDPLQETVLGLLALDERDRAAEGLRRLPQPGDGATVDLVTGALTAFSVDQGRLGRAEATLRRFLRSRELRPAEAIATRLHLASLLAGRGRDAAVRQELEEIYRGALASVGVSGGPEPSLAIHLALAGKLSARQGAPEAARRALRGIEELDLEGAAPIFRAYRWILEAELAAVEGDLGAAVGFARASVRTVESFQGRETLARLLERSGEREAAAREYEWLVEHRAWAFFECSTSFTCAESTLDLLEWHRALFRLARLRESAGEPERAIALYRDLDRRWHDGDAEIPVLRDARARLRSLIASHQFVP